MKPCHGCIAVFAAVLTVAACGDDPTGLDRAPFDPSGTWEGLAQGIINGSEPFEGLNRPGIIGDCLT